jgi:hypothetical protein
VCDMNQGDFMNLVDLRPKKRSKWRIALGKLYYTTKRRITWFINRRIYARTCTSQRLPFQSFTHQTPLLRQLKNVDMWYQYNKIINLKLAIKKLDGLILKPGETFSYWRCSNPQIQSYEVYESSHKMEMAFRRRVYNGQKVQIDDEFVAENYAIMMYQPYLENLT